MRKSLDRQNSKSWERDWLPMAGMLSEVAVLFIKLLIHIYNRKFAGLAPLLPPNAESGRISISAFERMAALAAEGPESDADSEGGNA
jgi:hypothetical protein